MKFCKKCNRVFNDTAVYCPECGEKLTEPAEYDIFGEPLKEESTPKDDGVVLDRFGNPINKKEDTISTIKDKSGEILALLSVGFFLIPIWGLGECIASIILNSGEHNRAKRGYLILSIITTILSVVWLVVVLKSGILNEIA